MTTDTISTFIPLGWVSPHLVTPRFTHNYWSGGNKPTSQNSLPLPASTRANSNRLFPCRGQLGVNGSNMDAPTTLYSYSYGTNFSWSQGLFFIRGTSAYTHLPSRWEGKCSFGYIISSVTWANDPPQCPIKESVSKLEHGGHQWHLTSSPTTILTGITGTATEGIGSCVRAQSCLAFCDPVDCSPLSASVHGIFQVRIVEWVAISSSPGHLPEPEIKPASLALAGGFFTTQPPGKPTSFHIH